jgi:SAM-dependent methyltransferase
MELRDAARLVGPAVRPTGGTWADLGAGTGTFTRALATLLGHDGHVIAVERDPTCIHVLEQLARARTHGEASIVALHADFTTPLPLRMLDGVLLANALHYVPADEQGRVLEDLSLMLRPAGRILLVEYDERPASRWVPHPVSLRRFVELVAPLTPAAPVRVGERHSAFGGAMYAAFVEMRAGE